MKIFISLVFTSSLLRFNDNKVNGIDRNMDEGRAEWKDRLCREEVIRVFGLK